LKSAIGNYSIAGKRGQWPAAEDTSLPYLTYHGEGGSRPREASISEK